MRAQNDPYALVPTITRTIREMAAEQPVERASTLQHIRAEVMAPDRLNAIVFGGFATLALLISGVGVAGVLAFGQRAHARVRNPVGSRRSATQHSYPHASGRPRDWDFWRDHGNCSWLCLPARDRQVHSRHSAAGRAAFALSATVILLAAVVASALPALRAAGIDALQALLAE